MVIKEEEITTDDALCIHDFNEKLYSEALESVSPVHKIPLRASVFKRKCRQYTKLQCHISLYFLYFLKRELY